ncbi:2-dehydropantoate 2-reductase [Allomuricauda ruestringensis DSM 13258]|uniref:2-dehydropantoate 2-reductase n=1 Tax=Allomuricauda ruestringensis (strain DSM 13258 / CIP 107369 / LMG 19739 / B1) TaxID=886377 RepID=G2PQC1_ALLRU|nr:2-dehydropantoate 2-reductase [Allomuricauda ruestringensis]AEM71627.1 2-dehydropantoate 2-reductase [Allomuricauda ruestringensis DSM 13258]
MKNSKIYIVGSGAIGKALAVFLQQENKQVVLVRGREDNIPDTEDTITVVGKDNTFQQRIITTTFSAIQAINGIVLIATKAFANTVIAKKLKDKEGDFSLVLLQNGLHVERPFQEFDKVYRCVLFSTSQVTEDNKVTFKSVMSSPVGNLQGNNDGLEDVIDKINTPYFSFHSEPDITRHIWTKVIANCAFNSICPLLETDNGIFIRNANALQLARTIIEECVSLAQRQGIDLDCDTIEKNLMLISQRSDGQLISTYVDILHNRRTEIESLNLEVAKLADDLGIPETVTHTRLLGELIQLKSAIKMK